ncbi:hypothetical protein KKH36_00530 [Patescibacteria group bacterium]|nr:hypothetical protein [Patescibacteria group bacterium]
MNKIERVTTEMFSSTLRKVMILTATNCFNKFDHTIVWAIDMMYQRFIKKLKTGEIRNFKHPHSVRIVKGFFLAPGVLLKKGDVFSSHSGKWEVCNSSVVDTILTEDEFIWVRPAKK